jgi:hypothetical protein
VTLQGGFTSAYSTTTTPFTVNIGGLRNPRTTATTSTFQVATYDSSGYKIAEKTTGITTAMTITPDIPSFAVTPASVINGASNSYTISVTSPIPLLNTDKLVMTFPSEITMTTPSPLCSTGTNVLTVTCTRTG